MIRTFLLYFLLLIPSFANACECEVRSARLASYVVKAEILELFSGVPEEGLPSIPEDLDFSTSAHPAIAKIKVLDIYQGNPPDEVFYLEYPDSSWTCGYDLFTGEKRNFVIFEDIIENTKFITSGNKCDYERWETIR